MFIVLWFILSSLKLPSDMILRFYRIGLMNEWFLVGIKLYGSIAKECFEVLLICSQSLKVSSIFLPLFAIWVTFRFSVLRLYPEYLRILMVTSPLLIILADREESYWVLVLYHTYGTMTPPNSMKVRKCRCHLQANRGLRYSYLSVPSLL